MSAGGVVVSAGGVSAGGVAGVGSEAGGVVSGCVGAGVCGAAGAEACVCVCGAELAGGLLCVTVFAVVFTGAGGGTAAVATVLAGAAWAVVSALKTLAATFTAGRTDELLACTAFLPEKCPTANTPPANTNNSASAPASINRLCNRRPVDAASCASGSRINVLPPSWYSVPLI